MLTAAEVKHVAILANLSLSEEEIEKFRIQLSEIINYISLLNKLETEKIIPTTQITGLTNTFREDKIESSRILTPSEALKNVPSKYTKFFIAPAVF